MKRREAREKAFQFLFQMDIHTDDLSLAIHDYLEEQENDDFLRTLIEGVIEKKAEIDQTIIDHLENWTLERLPSVERTILRLATYEIHFIDDIPTNVSINEAVDLGKVFGDEKSGKFINGVLSKIMTQGGKVE